MRIAECKTQRIEQKERAKKSEGYSVCINCHLSIINRQSKIVN